MSLGRLACSSSSDIFQVQAAAKRFLVHKDRPKLQTASCYVFCAAFNCPSTAQQQAILLARQIGDMGLDRRASQGKIEWRAQSAADVDRVFSLAEDPAAQTIF